MDPSSPAFDPSAVIAAELPLQTFIVKGVGAVGKSLGGVSTWQVLLTLLVLAVTYDQGMSLFRVCHLQCLC